MGVRFFVPQVAVDPLDAQLAEKIVDLVVADVRDVQLHQYSSSNA